jgi:phosphoribosylamine-glycine ligase
MGRPKALTPQLKEEICERILNGETVRQIAADEHMPHASTIYRALSDDGDPEFRDHYARAKDIQLYRLEDELLEIADAATSDTVQESRLRIDTRKWIMSKHAPKKYGERVQQDIELPQNTGAVPFAIINMHGRPEGVSED